jgi:selenophosphate synthase
MKLTEWTTCGVCPPLVDDPADFGAIAAANACSDVGRSRGHRELDA